MRGAFYKMSEEEFITVENMYKKEVFDGINEKRDRLLPRITKIKDNVNSLTDENVTIPNVGIYYNNKISELSREFKEHGLSFFIKKVDNSIVPSFVGLAIRDDLEEKFFDTQNALLEYIHEILEVSEQQKEKFDGTFYNLLMRIKAIFGKADFSISDEQRRKLKESLQGYKNACERIYDYNLEDNIVNALVKGIIKINTFEKQIYNNDDFNMVFILLEDDIIPDLKTLGLEHLIPRLKDAINKEFQISSRDESNYNPNFKQSIDLNGNNRYQGWDSDRDKER